MFWGIFSEFLEEKEVVDIEEDESGDDSLPKYLSNPISSVASSSARKPSSSHQSLQSEAGSYPNPPSQQSSVAASAHKPKSSHQCPCSHHVPSSCISVPPWWALGPYFPSLQGQPPFPMSNVALTANHQSGSHLSIRQGAARVYRSTPPRLWNAASNQSHIKPENIKPTPTPTSNRNDNIKPVTEC